MILDIQYNIDNQGACGSSPTCSCWMIDNADGSFSDETECYDNEWGPSRYAPLGDYTMGVTCSYDDQPNNVGEAYLFDVMVVEDVCTGSDVGRADGTGDLVEVVAFVMEDSTEPFDISYYINTFDILSQNDLISSEVLSA